jgi:hypothetical protein
MRAFPEYSYFIFSRAIGIGSKKNQVFLKSQNMRTPSQGFSMWKQHSAKLRIFFGKGLSPSSSIHPDYSKMKEDLRGIPHHPTG